MRKLSIALVAICGLTPSLALPDVARELKRMVGYTVVYGGYVTDVFDRNYSEKVIKLDNGWQFKLDCLILGPLPMTDVAVLGKRFPEELLKKYPDLPSYLQYQFKIVIDRDVCDASMVR